MSRPARALAPLLACLSLLLASCALPASADAPQGAADDDRPLVLTTFTVLADMARVVAGDRLRVESLLDVGAEVHGYEPTPADLRRAADADLVLDNGRGLEAWSARFLADVDAPHVVVGEGVGPLPVARRTATTGAGDPGGPVDPHAWMSPEGGVAYVTRMAEAFGELDPAGAAGYRARAAAYATQLRDLRGEMLKALATVPPAARVLVTCEGAFGYLARDAGLEEASLWRVNAEQQATPRAVADVVELVREREVPAVFCESTVSDRAQRQVAREAGTRLGGTLYVDSLSGPDGPVPTYLDLLRHDVDVLVAGLTGGATTAGAR